MLILPSRLRYPTSSAVVIAARLLCVDSPPTAMPTSMPTAKPTSRPTSMPTAMGGEPGPLCQPRSMPTIMPTAKGGEPGPRCQPTSGPLENLKLVCLLYPALSMMVTVSGDDARHASDHDTKGHALCVPSPCSIRHACALIHPCMRFLILPMHETIHTRCLRLVMLALTAFVCL